MTSRELLYIKTIADEKSITRAAQKLYLTQPSLSHCVMNIEKQLGTKLFRRTSGQQADDHSLQLIFTVQIFLFLRHLHHIAESSHGTRHNRNLLYRFRILIQTRNQCMTHFVICHYLLFFFS